MANTDPPGYRLNAKLRGARAIPITRMVDVYESLAFAMNLADKGEIVRVEQWVDWSRKERANGDALVRVLFMLIGVSGLNADDIAQLGRDLRNVSNARQRPAKLVQGPRERNSPRLW